MKFAHITTVTDNIVTLSVSSPCLPAADLQKLSSKLCRTHGQAVPTASKVENKAKPKTILAMVVSCPTSHRSGLVL